MSNLPNPETVDLLVVITRLHANRCASEDEFDRDWASPSPAQGLGGVIEDVNGKHGYWVMSGDSKAGVLVIHGHNRLLKKIDGDFQNAVISHLDRTGLKTDKPFSRLAILVHGEIPEIGPIDGRLSEVNDYSPRLYIRDKLDLRCPNGLELYDYCLRGKLPAALEVPKTLEAKGISKEHQNLTVTLFRIGPAVELIVRSMQHIILELRLLFDLHFGASAKVDGILEQLSDCHKRLNSDGLWKNACTAKAREYLCDISTIHGYLAIPAQDLFRLHEDSTKALFLKLYEGHGGDNFLNCDAHVINAIKPFLETGAPPSSRPNDNQETRKKIDTGLLVLSARLEALIPAANAEDHRRKKVLGGGAK